MPVQFRRNIYVDGKLLFPTGMLSVVETFGHDERGHPFLTVKKRPDHQIFEMDFEFTRCTNGILANICSCCE